MTTPRATPRRAAAAPAAAAGEPYNILPIHDLLAEHPSLRFPEVRAAAAALRAVGGLRPPPYSQGRADQDLMDWLGAFFGFQRDNVRNQREHLVLLLANAQMRLSSADFSDALEPRIARSLRNYTSWCGFLGRSPNVYVPDADPCADLLFAACGGWDLGDKRVAVAVGLPRLRKISGSATAYGGSAAGEHDLSKHQIC